MSLKKQIEQTKKEIKSTGLDTDDLFEYTRRHSGLEDEENGMKLCNSTQSLLQLQEKYIEKLEKKIKKLETKIENFESSK